MPPRPPEPDPVDWVRERWAEQELPDPERFSAVASLLRAHAVVVGGLEAALRPFELGRTSYLALVTLGVSPGGARKLSYLSRYLMVHPTSVKLLVEALEARGAVRREPHPTDRRASLAVLTDDGRRLLREATQAASAAGFGMEGVSPATLRRVTGALGDVRRATGDLDG